MSAGVCTILKSRPRRVRRSVSNNSIDVYGAVSVKKIWLEEGDTLTTEHLSESHDTGCFGSRKRHVWSLHTNLSCTQQCSKCQKRILARRAAYKCTACKKLCHLKCASYESPVSVRTRSRTKLFEEKQNLMAMKYPDRVGVKHTTALKKKKQDYSSIAAENYDPGESESLAEFVMEEEKCKEECSTPTIGHNMTPQSQAKQTIGKMRTNFVRRCKSIKKKVEKLKDKLNCEDHKKTEKETTQESHLETANGSEETNTSAREAWLCSPIRKRMRSKLEENYENDRSEVERLAYKRITRKRRLTAYEFELRNMCERLDVVEKKIHDLEQAIPQEVEEWRKLQQKFLISAGNFGSQIDTEEPITVHETTPKIPISDENIPSSISFAMSDEMNRIPESSFPYHKDTGKDKSGDQTHAESVEREESLPLLMRPRLQIGELRETSGGLTEDQQTSTPVTNKEISFRSATKKYQRSQITHTNFTHIKVENSETTTCNIDKDNGVTDTKMDIDDQIAPKLSCEKNILSPNQLAVKSFLERRRKSSSNNLENDPEISTEKKILSPNQLAVQKFLERRKSSASDSRLSDQRADSEETEGAGSNSPAFASSTFTNGNGDMVNLNFNMSPIPFTCKNGFDSSSASHTKISEELKTNGGKRSSVERNALNMSALSYTFRNDSSMIHTDANENHSGFSGNLSRMRHEIPERVDSPKLMFEAMQSQASARLPEGHQSPAASATGLSLTNVTDFTADYPNSFTDNKTAITKTQVSDNITSTNAKRFSNDFLMQIKVGVKLKDTSSESRESGEETALDQASGDSEFKLVYNKIVKHNRKSKNRNNHTEFTVGRVIIDERGDNDYKDNIKGHYSKFGSKYQELFRLYKTEQPSVVVASCEEKKGSFNSIGPPLPPKPKMNNDAQEQENVIENHFPIETNKYELNLKSDIDTNIALEKETATDDTEDTKQLILDMKDTGDIIPVKSGTFPRTSKKHYNCDHIDHGGGYEKAASYAGSLDIDRRSVHTETGSLDRYGDAKYHFLHEKGMIKICSPRLELVSESPSSKRKLQPKENTENHISEEDTETVESKSDISGIVIDNELQLTEFKKRLEDFDDTTDQNKVLEKPDDVKESTLVLNSCEKEKIGNCHQVDESFCSDALARQRDITNDIFENCFEMIDNNQATLEHVFDWINKDHNSDNGVKDKLDALVKEDTEANFNNEQSMQYPLDDSVYYSFHGQSEEIRNVINDINSDAQCSLPEGHLIKDFLISVMNGNQTAVSEFLKSDIVIPYDSLKQAIDFAIGQRNRSMTQELLDCACRDLIELNKNNNVVEVWPAYCLEDEWDPVFVLLLDNDCKSEWSEYLGYKVYTRKFCAVSKEAALALNSNITNINPLTFNDFEKLEQAIEQAGLYDNSNITVINLCPCRSRKWGEEIILEPCIVIHCLVKGLIPFNKQPFPKSILGIPVDVREAYFIQGVLKVPQFNDWLNAESSAEVSGMNETGSTSEDSASENKSLNLTSTAENVISENSDDGSERAGSNPLTDQKIGDLEDEGMDCHERAEDDSYKVKLPQNEIIKTSWNNENTCLKMGTCIYDKARTNLGTLGGFINLEDGQLGFITCAHVVGLETEKPVLAGDRDGSQKPLKNVCGYVHKAVAHAGSGGGTGVDAAVVTITCGHPDYPEFIDVQKGRLESSGISNPPSFCLGRILALEAIGRYWKSDVIKIGAKTGLTVGHLYSCRTYVRKKSQGIDQKMNGETLNFFNQLEVMPNSESVRFFDFGDSGALVFMHLNDHELYCIGLAIGCTSYGSCIVTPIEHVFKELQLPEEFYNFNQVVD